jgi:TraK protein
MRDKQYYINSIQQILCLILTASLIAFSNNAWAKEIEYNDEEIAVRVTAGEPTQIRFPGMITGGYKKNFSAISLERKDSDLIIFANDKIDEVGEAIVVRLQDGRSYSLRFQRSNNENPRDDIVKIKDRRGSIIDSKEEGQPMYDDKRPTKAPNTHAAGAIREAIKVIEFGKQTMTGYQVNDQHKGETVLNDGAMQATIDKIFVGPNLWVYVLDVKNMLDVGQKVNPATFRLDGTIAISFNNWDLAPRPLDIEQQIAKKHLAKAYIVTKAR